MARLAGKSWVAFASLAIVVGLVQIALAQREGGRGGRGGGMMFSPSMLASRDVVQEELKLTDDQKQKIEEITDAARESMQALRDQEGGTGRREAFAKIASDSAARLAEVLNDDQEQRLAGIVLQVDLGTGLNQPYVIEQLVLTEEQQTKLDEARDTNRRAMRDAFGDLRDASGDERRAKMTELRATAEQNIKDVLTSEQQAKVEELKGEPVDIPMRGGFGGRGRRAGANN